MHSWAQTTRGVLAAPLPRPLRMQCHSEPRGHSPGQRLKSRIRCLPAEWPGRLHTFCPLGTSETCRTSCPGHSHRAQLLVGPALPAAQVAGRCCVCSTLPSVSPPQVWWQQRPCLDGLMRVSTGMTAAHVDGCRPPPLSHVSARKVCTERPLSPTKACRPGPSCLQCAVPGSGHFSEILRPVRWGTTQGPVWPRHRDQTRKGGAGRRPGRRPLRHHRVQCQLAD